MILITISDCNKFCVKCWKQTQICNIWKKWPFHCSKFSLKRHSMTACPTRQPFCKFAAPENVVCCAWILCLPRRISVNIPYCKVQNMINIMIYHYILTNICLNLLHTLGKWQMTNMIHDLCSSGIKKCSTWDPPEKSAKAEPDPRGSVRMLL